MNLLKRLMLLLIFITVILSAEQPPKPNQNETTYFDIELEYIKVSELLITATKVIKQEKKRWENIHGNPIGDIVNVIDKNDNVTIDIEINTQVDTIINNQPITRKYIIGTPKNKNINTNLDFIILATYSISDGLKPAICVGYKPFRKVNIGMLKKVGASIYTTIYSAGSTLYYCPTDHLSLHIMGGYSIAAKDVSLGLGIGAQF